MVNPRNHYEVGLLIGDGKDIRAWGELLLAIALDSMSQGAVSDLPDTAGYLAVGVKLAGPWELYPTDRRRTTSSMRAALLVGAGALSRREAVRLATAMLERAFPDMPASTAENMRRCMAEWEAARLV